MLKGHVETVKRTLYEIASKYGFTIAHMEIGKDDHIHLLVSALPELSVTNIMRWLKAIVQEMSGITNQSPEEAGSSFVVTELLC